MAQLVIRDCGLLSGGKATIVCEEGIVTEVIGENGTPPESDAVINGRDMMVLPGFSNTHTHASMSILRGIGEDLELDRWLGESIWPLESRMTLDHLKAGMRLACLEMIRSGTTMFNDMYFRQGEVAEVVSEMGIRAVLGEGFIDMNSDEIRERNIASTLETIRKIRSLGSDLITTAVCPHAIYTVSEEGLLWCRDTAKIRGLPIHIHLSETKDEVRRCREQHGSGPVDYLNGLDLLDDSVTAAHCVHLDRSEMDILAEKGVRISHNPISNMKLSSGGPMNLSAMMDRGMNVTLGTDGAASNNSLDMFQTMKTAGLLSKHTWGVGAVSASRILQMAAGGTTLNAGNSDSYIREGMKADLILIDMRHPSMNPPNDHLSNIVYSSSGEAVKYTIVAGRILMDDGKVDGEENIIEEARSAALDLLSRGD